jgi:hypothetical protein
MAADYVSVSGLASAIRATIEHVSQNGRMRKKRPDGSLLSQGEQAHIANFSRRDGTWLSGFLQEPENPGRVSLVLDDDLSNEFLSASPTRSSADFGRNYEVLDVLRTSMHAARAPHGGAGDFSMQALQSKVRSAMLQGAACRRVEDQEIANELLKWVVGRRRSRTVLLGGGQRPLLAAGGCSGRCTGICGTILHQLHATALTSAAAVMQRPAPKAGP